MYLIVYLERDETGTGGCNEANYAQGRHTP